MSIQYNISKNSIASVLIQKECFSDWANKQQKQNQNENHKTEKKTNVVPKLNVGGLQI